MPGYSGAPGKAFILKKQDDDVVIVAAVRTPLTKVCHRKRRIAIENPLYLTFTRPRKVASKIHDRRRFWQPL